MKSRATDASTWGFLGALALSSPAYAGDAHVEKLLAQAGVEYEVNDAGEIAVGVAFEDERSQVVYVASKADSIETLAVREVWSLAFMSKRPITAELANQLLKENGEWTVGAWQLVQDGNDHLVLFSVKIPVDAKGTNLVDAVNIVGTVADELEAEITKNDEF